MSAHKYVSRLVGDKTILVCEACNIKESDVRTYRESPYCEKTPEAIDARERYEYSHLASARDCGREEGVDFFKSRSERWEYLSNKYGEL